MNYTSTTNSSTFNFLPINTGSNNQYLCYDIILQRLYERMDYMCKKHCRVLFVRFDVRFPQHYQNDGGNREISHLFKILKENGSNNGFDLQFIWAREQSREKHQHYHCVALLNGSRNKNAYSFLLEVSRIWSHVLGCDATGLIHQCGANDQGQQSNNGIMIQRPVQKAVGNELEMQQADFDKNFAICFEWGSYLAKENQKMNTPPGLRRFGVSQMR